MILILILAPPTLGARGHLPHLPSPSYATVSFLLAFFLSFFLSLSVSVCRRMSLVYLYLSLLSLSVSLCAILSLFSRCLSVCLPVSLFLFCVFFHFSSPSSLFPIIVFAYLFKFRPRL